MTAEHVSHLELVVEQTQDDILRSILSEKLKLTEEELAEHTLVSLAELVVKRLVAAEVKISWLQPTSGPWD